MKTRLPRRSSSSSKTRVKTLLHTSLWNSFRNNISLRLVNVRGCCQVVSSILHPLPQNLYASTVDHVRGHSMFDHEETQIRGLAAVRILTIDSQAKSKGLQLPEASSPTRPSYYSTKPPVPSIQEPKISYSKHSTTSARTARRSASPISYRRFRKPTTS
jgi:hypothetical protein